MQEDVTKKVKKKNIFARTKLYLFEYSAMQVANIWVGTAISITVFSLFSLSSKSGISSSTMEGLAWVFGLILIFFPISIILYARTTAEEIQNNARLNQRFRKVVFYLMLTVVTISAVCFLASTVYTATRALFGVEDTSSLLTVAAPSAVTLLFHVYFLGFVLKREASSLKLRKFNILALSFVAALLGALVLGLALIKGQGASKDKRITGDLTLISAEIKSEYRKTSTLPSSINDLDGLDSQDIKDKFVKGEYAYKQVPNNGGYDMPVPLGGVEPSLDMSYPDIAVSPPNQYQLCATFSTKLDGYNYYDSGTTIDRSLLYYQNEFNYHPKGYHCFDLYAY